MRKASPWLSMFVIAILVLGAGALVGCGGDDGDTTTTAATTATAAGTETTGGTTGSSISTADIKLVTDGVITVGSDTAFPPFESMVGTVAEGFDVDMVAAIGEKIGIHTEFKTETFDTLIPTLKAGGKFDMIASSMTITDERKQEIDFSDPYIDSNQSIAVQEGSDIKDETDLSGKKVGVQSGTTGEAWAQENLTDATMVPFKTATDALSALQAGNVDAVVNDLPVSAYIVKDTSRGLKIIKEIPTGEQYGFAVSKDNPALLAAINQASEGREGRRHLRRDLRQVVRGGSVARGQRLRVRLQGRAG